MILIDTTTLILQDILDPAQSYAILSHVWGPPSDEVTYQEMVAPERSATTLAKPGYTKIIKTCEIAREEYDLKFAWVDTCCINKASSAELSEAINSMFRWYKDAWVCFAYLSDVNDDPFSFDKSRWFTRGWTLQELIAPHDILFFDGDWQPRGDKRTMSKEISAVTNIPAHILDHSMELSEVPVAKRFSWASYRDTTRVEDRAYSLLGIFDINMPMLYGEGSKAFLRLQEQIMAESADMSIFLWIDDIQHQGYSGLLAPSPGYFRSSGQVKIEPIFRPCDFYLTNRGIRLKLAFGQDPETGLVVLPLQHSAEPSGKPVSVLLRNIGHDLFVRARPDTFTDAIAQKTNTVLTVVKHLSSSQVRTITTNSVRVIMPENVLVTKVEPKGGWEPLERKLYIGLSHNFFGYIVFQKLDHPPFAVVLCYQDREWSVKIWDGEQWPSVQETIHKHRNRIFAELGRANSTKYSSSTHIMDPDRTGGTLVHTQHFITPRIRLTHFDANDIPSSFDVQE
jgi:hypothetical protein